MARKQQQQLEKEAWQWAENTEPADVTQEHIETAYRLQLPGCKKGTCRRNCRGNPYCLNCLGEAEWFREISDSEWHDIEDPEQERRKEGAFVGLRNLGATCYVNTFIQVWFHNLTFRSAIYQWCDPEAGTVNVSPQHRVSESVPEEKCPTQTDVCKSAESASTTSESVELCNNVKKSSPVYGPDQKPIATMEDDKDLMPNTVCGHLQLLFGLLQFSNRRYIDPTQFINCLGLDVGQQQDAQEFSKLFMSVLEDQLSRQPGVSHDGVCDSVSSTHSVPVANLVEDQFRGEYNYVTQCNHCGMNSSRPSQFYELDLNIKGHKDLDECIGEFLQEEKLDGDNQYFCATCNCKQNATRKIKLQSLPKVLNLQLLRFVFDRKSGHKKKLNTSIQFPELLDLSKYLVPGGSSNLYVLSAVLIHRGPSAYSGHYIAHIKDKITQSWYKFNDEDVDKIGGRDLHLGSEEDIVEGKGAKKPRATKGFHCSRNAYMLVYQQQESANKGLVKIPTFESLAPRVQVYIEMDRQRFNRWVDEIIKMRESNIQCGHARQQEVQGIYNMMAVGEGQMYEWIATEWISKWLLANTDKYVPVVDNSGLLCRHGSLHPEKVPKAKCVTASAVDVVYSKYGGGPRLKGKDVLCRTCILELCKVIRTKARLAQDQKVISAVLKSCNTADDPVQDGYWVGKASLRSWRRLVLEKLESPEQAKDGTSSDVSKDNGEVQSEVTGPADNGDIESDQERLTFNEDLLCQEHGQLDLEDGRRRLVPRDIWMRLKTYFPEAAEFSQTDSVCEKCHSALESEERAREEAKSMALKQKAALGDLYHNKNRPTWSNKSTYLNIISQDFLETWRKFIREPTKTDVVTKVVNGSLLCPHQGFISDLGSSSPGGFVYIWPSEWEALTKMMSFDVEIQVTQIVEESGDVSLLVSPDLCAECCQAKRDADQAAQLHYTNANIYVRKLTTEIKTLLPGVVGAIEPGLPISKDNSDQDDPEFSNLQGNGKRKKGTSNGMSSVPEKAAKLVRRSNRHRTMRGEKILAVSAKQTLWDLKMQVMKLFSAAPMDQHLFVDGAEIVGNQRTLADLNVTPGTVVYLRVDEPCDDPLFMDDAAKASRPEEGFKGTGLLGN